MEVKRPVYSAVVEAWLETLTEDELDVEWCYETMRKALKNAVGAKRAKLYKFNLKSEWDDEGKQIVIDGNGGNGDCNDCPGGD